VSPYPGQGACYQEGDLRAYWPRRRAQGVSYLAAVTAVAVKLCPVVWRIMTERRDHLPQRPATVTTSANQA